MSKPIREQILNNPRLVLSEFKTEDIVILKNSLEVTAKQILCKFGYMKLDSQGLDIYTIEEIFSKMPDETKIMFWSINNARYLLELERQLNNKHVETIQMQQTQLSEQQIQIVRLQTKLN